jgi:hypothetical protein
MRKPYRDPYIDNLLAGDEIIPDDKEYKIASLEEAEEFAKKRNIPEDPENE